MDHLSEKTVKETLVMGVGNILLRDEGIGVHVVREMMKMDLPDEVEVLDGGTAAIDLLHAVEGRRRMIVIDALLIEGEEPGAVYRLTPDQLQPTFRGKTSLHQLGLIEVLEMAYLIGEAPDTVIFGIVPESIGSFGLEPTPRVRARIPQIIDLVIKEINDPPKTQEG